MLNEKQWCDEVTKGLTNLNNGQTATNTSLSNINGALTRLTVSFDQKVGDHEKRMHKSKISIVPKAWNALPGSSRMKAVVFIIGSLIAAALNVDLSALDLSALGL